MLLNQLFAPKKLFEGGNLASHKADGQPMPGWQGVPGQHQAQELDLNVHNRTEVVAVLSDLLHSINDLFAQQYKEPLWHENSVKAQKFLSGSTMRFFDKKIPDEEFVRVKPTVGDIDTQAPDKHEGTIKQFLTGLIGKQVGDTKFIGFSPGNNQYTSMWQVTLQDMPVKLQIDFEYGSHDPTTGLPTPWQEYSHSSSWEDLSAGIKGVFHKYIDRALPYASTVSTKYVARVLKKSTKISDEPVTDSDYSFAVSGQGGGGVSRKYVPYDDPSTGAPMERDGIPVMQLLDPANRQYIQNLGQQFEIFFGRKPKGNDQQLKNSFVGTVDLANKYLDDQQRTELFNRFVSICFEPGSQMITKGDPVRDRTIKMAAIDYMIQNMKLANPQAMRKQAIKTAMDYEQAFTSKQAGKGLNEAEVKAQFRKSMPHLKDLKPIDFLDLLDELDQGDGKFKLKNIPLNVKVDGFGGRFGKNSEGKPFMATSRTEPRYQAGFVDYHQKKGTTDPEILGRAQLFDDLFSEMMTAVEMVDNKLGPDFLVNKQVTCEVLYLPFATETPEGKLKFVGIQYDKLPQGVELALVPFRVTDATTGEDIPDSNKAVKALTGVGRQGSVMFIDNSLTQNDELDVTEIINVLDNIEELKQIVSDTAGKRDRASLDLRRQVEEKLQPVKVELEKAIINDPNIIGKDLLGKDYEGIVINSRLGPIKITSQEQRDVISTKNAAKISARTEQPRGEAKTAVVAIGSFIGHKGHEELFTYTINKAKEVGGDPYLFIGNAEGKNDPIPPDVKVQTWHKLYPEYAKNISTVQEGGQLIQKIKHELINPLPGKPPRYDNIIIMVGEDRAGMNMPTALMKAVNKFQGYEHVKISLDVTPRGTGISGTALRNSLKNDPPEKALATWSNAFDVNKLGVDWIKHLMNITRKGMGIQMTQPPAQQPAAQPAPMAEMRLFNALMAPKHRLVEADDSKFVGFMNQALGKKVDEPSKKSKSGIDDYDNAPTMNLDSYKPALDFCMKIIQKLNSTQKTKLSTKGEHGVVRWLTKQATDAGLVPNKFVEEDIDEVQEQLPEIFKDPAITSWALVLTDGEPLPKPPSKGPFNIEMNKGYGPGKDDKGNSWGGGYKNQDWVTVDTLDNLPDAEKMFQGLVRRNSKYYFGITDATGKWAKFYDPSKEQGVAEGQLELNTPNPVVVISDTKTGKILDKINLNIAAQKYRLGNPADVKNQLAHQNYTNIGNYTISAPMTGQPQDQTTTGQKNTFATVEGGIATVGWPDDEDSHTNNRPPVNVGGTFPARPVVKRGSLVKASGLTGVYRVMDILRDEAKIVQEIPRTGVSTYVPMSDLRVWTNKPIREKDVAEGSGGAQYKIKSIGRDAKGDYYISPSTGKKVYKSGVKRGDHENPKTGEHKGVAEGLGKHVAGAALAGAMALGGAGAHAQSSGEDYLPDIVAHVKFKVNGKEISKDINLGTQYKSPREAAEALEKFLRSKGIKYFEYDLERIKPKDDDYMDKTPYTDPTSNESVEEAMSAAVRFQRAWERQQAKSAASRKRGEELLNPKKKEEPKPEEKKTEMMDPDKFSGYPKNKLGSAAHLKGTTKRGAHAGDLVGETDKKKGADGKACWDGYRYNGTENGSDKCVKIGEAWEIEMSHAISKLFENR